MIVGINRHTWRENKTENWRSSYKIHLISWLVFVFWECIIIGLIYGAFGNFFNYAVHYSINIFLFYIHTWLIEKALKTRHHIFWRTPLFFIAEITGYIILVFYMDNLLAAHTNLLNGSLDTDKRRILLLLWRSLYFIFFSTGYYFLKHYLKERNIRENTERLNSEVMMEKKKIENALIMSRNAFLKAQINPHLLFNTFEFLHNKMKILAPEDAKLMIYLSEIVRFAAATEFHDGAVKLGDEISQCRNLIKIYNITQEKAFIKVSCSEDVCELSFIPLVVITLLENMLKHGLISDNERYAGIDIYTESGKLKIESFNFYSIDKNVKGFGSGLDNIKSRLFFAYGELFTMMAGIDHHSIYRVEITVPLALVRPEKS